MKKKVVSIIIGSMMFGGIVSAASMWGAYKGNDIVRLTVDGAPVKVTDVPAINYNNRTMIPIYLLKEAGINYQWDQKNKTVNITSPKNSNSGAKDSTVVTTNTQTKKSLTTQEIAKLMDRVGILYTYDENGDALASGSGFVIYDNWFVSNFHVHADSSGMVAKIDNQYYDNEGWYWYANEDQDLYLTQLSTAYADDGMPIGSSPSKHLNVQTRLPEVGDKVYAIGSPQGLENTVSEGIVSGIRNNNGVTIIQHTADITYGSSGGALLNEYGEVIGITSGGQDGTNIGYAIPISYVVDAINAQ